MLHSMQLYLLISLLELINGHHAKVPSCFLATNQTVVPAGLTEQLRLLTIVSVLLPGFPIFYLLLTLLDAVTAHSACHMTATVDKLQLHGDGSRLKVSSLVVLLKL